MGYKTKIDWCDSSWNPVTGCKHDCEYCYARGIAERFGGASETHNNETCHECQWFTEGTGEIHDLKEPVYDFDNCRKAPYPFEFDPTFHRYRLNQPAKWSEPRTIFVCGMADLFGRWVPDDWIEAVINACLSAPQHRYLFLTKNPARYMYLIDNGIIPEDQPNFWLGSTATIPEMEFFWHNTVNTFVSIEPMLAPFKDMTDEGRDPASYTNWIIVGAESGNRKNKVIPEKSWVMELVECARKSDTPIFMKESLREIMGADFVQQFPWCGESSK